MDFNYTPNPNMGGIADYLTQRNQQFLDQNLNGIRSNAVGNGGLGGSRQGVAQGLAIGNAADSLQGNLAQLYGTDWNNAQNRGLQQYGMDQNFYTQQRGQDQSGAALGANIYDLASRDGWTGLNNASGIFNTTAGNNTTTTQSGSQGGGWQGAVGGALGGAQLGKSFGWW